MADFKTRLRRAVDEAGGVTAVCKAAGIARPTLYRALNGGEARLSVIDDIAKACHVSIDWLLNGDELDSLTAKYKPRKFIKIDAAMGALTAFKFGACEPVEIITLRQALELFQQFSFDIYVGHDS